MLLSSSKQHRSCLLLHTKQIHNRVPVACFVYGLTAQSYRKNTAVSLGCNAWFPIKRNDRKLKLHSGNRRLYVNFGFEIIIGRDKTTKDGGCVRDSSGSGEDLVAGLFWTRLWTFGPHKARDIYLQAQQMLIPHANLCAMELERKKKRYKTLILIARDSRIPTVFRNKQQSSVENWWHTVTHGRGSDGETVGWSG